MVQDLEDNGAAQRIVELHNTIDESTTEMIIGHQMRIVFHSMPRQCRDTLLVLRRSHAWNIEMYCPPVLFLQAMLSTTADASSGIGAGASTTVAAMVKHKRSLQRQLSRVSLVTFKMLESALTSVVDPGMDPHLRGTVLLCLGAMAESAAAVRDDGETGRAQGGTVATARASVGKMKGQSAAAGQSLIDRDLLLLFNEDTTPSITSTTSTAAAAYEAARPLDFHRDPNPEECIHATAVLQRLFQRSAELLVQFPGNDLLIQVCKVSAKLSEFHIGTPLGKMLVGAQLLLRKAEEWELFAAKHVSLREDMAALSALIARWRAVELRSWETLLRSKEVSYAQQAQRHWFTLMRMLAGIPLLLRRKTTAATATTAPGGKELSATTSGRPAKDVAASAAAVELEIAQSAAAAGFTVAASTLLEWPTLYQMIPYWLCRAATSQPTVSNPAALGATSSGGLTGNNSSDAKPPLTSSSSSSSSGVTEAVFLEQVFGTLDGFLRSSTVGEFPTRLHLVRLFALQLQQEVLIAQAQLQQCKQDGDMGEKQQEEEEEEQELVVGAASKKSKRSKGRKHSGSRGPATSSRAATVSGDEYVPPLEAKSKVATLLFSVWQYYDQFLPAVRRFQSSLREPIQQRLRGEVKMGKWDQLNAYALIEHSERTHRKLTKFLREYEGDVLQHPVSALLRREILDDFVNKAGELQTATQVPSFQFICPLLKTLEEQPELPPLPPLPDRDTNDDDDDEEEEEEEGESEEKEEGGDTNVGRGGGGSGEQKSGAGASKNTDKKGKKSKKDQQQGRVDFSVPSSFSGLVSEHYHHQARFVSASEAFDHKQKRGNGVHFAGIASPSLSAYVAEAVLARLQSLIPAERWQYLQEKYPRLASVRRYSNRMQSYLRGALVIQHTAATTTTTVATSTGGGKTTSTITTLARSKESTPKHVDTAADVADTADDKFRSFQGKACFGLQAAVTAEDICGEIFGRIESLRAENVPKPIKQRAVRDLLQTLRDHGVSHLRSDVPTQSRSPLALLLMPSPLPCDQTVDLAWSSGAPRDVLERAEVYFAKNLVEVGQLRAQATTVTSADVSHRDVMVMVALSENLFAQVLRLRGSVGAALRDAAQLMLQVQQLQSLPRLGSYVEHALSAPMTAASTVSTDKDPTSQSQSQSQSGAPKAADLIREYSALQADLKNNQRGAQVMLDNMIQLHSLLLTAVQANSVAINRRSESRVLGFSGDAFNLTQATEQATTTAASGATAAESPAAEHIEDGLSTTSTESDALPTISEAACKAVLAGVGRCINALAAIATANVQGSGDKESALCITSDSVCTHLLQQQQQQQVSIVHHAPLAKGACAGAKPQQSSSAIIILRQQQKLCSDGLGAFTAVRDTAAQLVSADVVVPIEARYQEFQDIVCHRGRTFVGTEPPVAAAVGTSVDESRAKDPVDGAVSDEREEKLCSMLHHCIGDCLIAVQKLRGISALPSAHSEDAEPSTAGGGGASSSSSSIRANAFVGCYGEELSQQLRSSASLAAATSGADADADTASDEMLLTDCISLSMASIAACQLHKVTSQLSDIHSFVTSSPPHCHAATARGNSLDTLSASQLLAHLSMVQLLEPLLLQLSEAYTILLDGVIQEYKSVSKLLYVCVRVFRTLLAKGICAAKAEDGEGDGAGGGTDLSGMIFEDDVEGTGMGEGEGKKDVSDQIDNEEQLLGLKDQKPPDQGDKNTQQQERKELKEEEKDKGVEMTQDFEGEMYDLPEEEKDQQNRDEESDDEGMEEAEKEMGDANAEDIVDEKQWNDSDNEDGDEKDGRDEKEKFERGSKMQGDSIEMRTKDDDDDDDKKQPQREEDEENKKQQPQDDADDDEGDGGGAGAAENKEDQINEDLEDNYMDKPMGVDVRKDEQKLQSEPEEQEGEAEPDAEGNQKQLDTDDAADADDPEQQERDGEGTAGAQDEQQADQPDDDDDGAEGVDGDDLPETMQLDGDGDNDDEKDDDDAQEGEDQDDDQEGGENAGQQQAQAMEVDPDYTPEEDKQDEDSSAKDENDDKPLSASSAGAAGMKPEEDEDKGDEKEEDEKNEEEEEKPEEKTPKGDDQPEPNSAAPATYGIRSKTGQEALLDGHDGGQEDNEADADDDDEGGEGEDAEKPAPAPQQPQGEGGVSQGEGKDGATHEVGGMDRESQGNTAPPARSLDEPPNPFKQAGNVNEKWHRRLNLVLPPHDDDDDDKDKDEDEDGFGDNDDGSVDDGGGKGLYEHAGAEEGAREQVLAETEAENAVHVPEQGERKPEEDGGADHEDDADDMGAMEEDQQDERKVKQRREERKRDRSDLEDGNQGDQADEEQEGFRGGKAKKKRTSSSAAPPPPPPLPSTADIEGGAPSPPHDNDGDEAESSSQGSGADSEVDQDDADADAEPKMDVDVDESEESDKAEDEPAAADGDDQQQNVKMFTKEGFIFGATADDAATASSRDKADSDEQHQQDQDLQQMMLMSGLSEEELSRGRTAWMQYRNATETYSAKLSEQLRLILEPTLATRLQGDYRTGKRINMRKVIPYVASGFRKDKIWLRRTKPAKRAYQVMVMIDNSASMKQAGSLALSSLATIANALVRLEIGELCVASFAEQVRVLHGFSEPFSEQAGAKVMSQFNFDAPSTMLSSSLQATVPVFERARQSAGGSGGQATVLQICFVISDARIDSDNRERLESTVRAMAEQHILVVLIILDQTDDPKDSIFHTRSVSFLGNKVVTKSYFDDFPFPYYVAIQHLEILPDVLADALKQWFELVRMQLAGN